MAGLEDIKKKRKAKEKEVSQAKNYKLFKDTMWDEYWHTYFEDKRQKEVTSEVKIVNEKGYEGPTNLHHFTVHEFNEALYFAMREYSSYVNFSQIENATYCFFMDHIISEKIEEKL